MVINKITYSDTTIIPKHGDITKGVLIGKKEKGSPFIWLECVDCGSGSIVRAHARIHTLWR